MNEDEDDDDEYEEEDSTSEGVDQAHPLPSLAGYRVDKKLSLVTSFKAHPNHHIPDFDHARWLFETKGTYGYYGNTLWPKDGAFERSEGGGFEQRPDFSERSSRPLTRKISVSTPVISPYRMLLKDWNSSPDAPICE